MPVYDLELTAFWESFEYTLVLAIYFFVLSSSTSSSPLGTSLIIAH